MEPWLNRSLHQHAVIDHVELAEAFAPQALACIRDLEKRGIAPDRVNPLGGATGRFPARR